jgi:hypothetical protein
MLFSLLQVLISGHKDKNTIPDAIIDLINKYPGGFDPVAVSRGEGRMKGGEGRGEERQRGGGREKMERGLGTHLWAQRQERHNRCHY